jgi:hypothetical protein
MTLIESAATEDVENTDVNITNDMAITMTDRFNILIPVHRCFGLSSVEQHRIRQHYNRPKHNVVQISGQVDTDGSFD